MNSLHGISHRLRIQLTGARRRVRSFPCLAPGLGLCLLLALAGASRARGQLFQRDPLTHREANQLRKAAGDPGKRIALLLRDAGRRLGEFEQFRHSHGEGRRPRMYRMLRQYRLIISELDDNVDQMTSGRKTSFMGKRKPAKPLRRVMKAENGFLSELLHIRSASSPADLASYHFELSNCVDRTRESLSNTRDDLREAQKPRKKKKKHV